MGNVTGVEDFESVLSEYYPCFGALMEVVVGPPAARGDTTPSPAAIPASQFPYIAAVEPQKRELYELVSETGEQSSRSVQGVSVRQGTTSTDSTEAMDIFGGASIEVPIRKGTAGLGFQGQWGTRSLSSTERKDVRTTDALEEMRNTLSRTTNLTQMYSLLQTYQFPNLPV